MVTVENGAFVQLGTIRASKVPDPCKSPSEIEAEVAEVGKNVQDFVALLDKSITNKL